jgi:hypothetical protein
MLALLTTENKKYQDGMASNGTMYRVNTLKIDHLVSPTLTFLNILEAGR